MAAALLRRKKVYTKSKVLASNEMRYGVVQVYSFPQSQKAFNSVSLFWLIGTINALKMTKAACSAVMLCERESGCCSGRAYIRRRSLFPLMAAALHSSLLFPPRERDLFRSRPVCCSLYLPALSSSFCKWPQDGKRKRHSAATTGCRR